MQNVWRYGINVLHLSIKLNKRKHLNLETMNYKAQSRKVKRSLIKGMAKHGKRIAVGEKMKIDRLAYDIEKLDQIYIKGKFYTVSDTFRKSYNEFSVDYKKNGRFEWAVFIDKDFLEIPF